MLLLLLTSMLMPTYKNMISILPFFHHHECKHSSNTSKKRQKTTKNVSTHPKSQDGTFLHSITPKKSTFKKQKPFKQQVSKKEVIDSIRMYIIMIPQFFRNLNHCYKQETVNWDTSNCFRRSSSFPIHASWDVPVYLFVSVHLCTCTPVCLVLRVVRWAQIKYDILIEPEYWYQMTNTWNVLNVFMQM